MSKFTENDAIERNGPVWATITDDFRPEPYEVSAIVTTVPASGDHYEILYDKPTFLKVDQSLVKKRIKEVAIPDVFSALVSLAEKRGSATIQLETDEGDLRITVTTGDKTGSEIILEEQRKKDPSRAAYEAKQIILEMLSALGERQWPSP
jgi:hypothetical protein